MSRNYGGSQRDRENASMDGLIQMLGKMGMQKDSQDAESKLKQLLQQKEGEQKLGQITAQSSADADLYGKKSTVDQQKSAADFKMAHDTAMEDAGRGIHVTNKVGDSSSGIAENDPLAKSMAGRAAAAAAANRAYMQGAKPLMDKYAAAAEGLDAVNDPKNLGSLGQARTMMLKAMGMNRYNSDEASAVVPQSLQGYVTNLFNAGTGDDKSPMNESQRQMTNQFFTGMLNHVKDQHAMVKQNALTSFNTNPYGAMDPATGQALASQLGSGLDGQIAGTLNKYKSAPTTGYTPGQTGQALKAPEQAPAGGLRGFFSKIWNGSPQAAGAPQAPAAAPAVSPATPAAPGGFDPSAYLKGGR